MARVYKTIAGLTYSTLDSALKHLGYVRDDAPDRVVYDNISNPNALLMYAPFKMADDVRGIDLFAARTIVDSFGILDSKDFDLLLMKLSGAQVVMTH